MVVGYQLHRTTIVNLLDLMVMWMMMMIDWMEIYQWLVGCYWLKMPCLVVDCSLNHWPMVVEEGWGDVSGFCVDVGLDWNPHPALFLFPLYEKREKKGCQRKVVRKCDEL